MQSRAFVSAVCPSVLRGNQGRIFPGQLNRLPVEGPGGLDERLMETGVDEGTIGRERRVWREQQKGMALQGVYVCLQKGHIPLS